MKDPREAITPEAHDNAGYATVVSMDTGLLFAAVRKYQVWRKVQYNLSEANSFLGSTNPTSKTCLKVRGNNMKVDVDVVHVCVYACVYTCVCMYVYAYVCVAWWMYVCNGM